MEGRALPVRICPMEGRALPVRICREAGQGQRKYGAETVKGGLTPV